MAFYNRSVFVLIIIFYVFIKSFDHNSVFQVDDKIHVIYRAGPIDGYRGEFYRYLSLIQLYAYHAKSY